MRMCSATYHVCRLSFERIDRQSKEFDAIFENIHCSGRPVGVLPSSTMLS
jgi:hypothetical protein